MTPALLAAPLAKIERSKAQIEELNSQIAAFFETGPYKPVSQFDEDADILIHRFELTRQIPHKINVIAGEILHNLRSPLDQMLCALALKSNLSESGVAFPFGRDINEFETELAKQKELPSDAHAFIRTTKPYQGGNDLLWNVHHLNRRDKHRVKLVPINVRTATTMSELVMWKGLALTLGSRSGQRMTLAKARPSKEEIEKLPSPSAVYSIPNGFFKFDNAGCSPEDSLEFMTTTPGAKFTTNFQPALDLTFRDVEGLKPEPVVAVLFQMREAVERVLMTFSRRFFG